VSLVGAVGEDGEWLIRDLEGYGVSVANVSIVKEVTGRAIVQLTPEGENCISASVLYPRLCVAPI